MRYICPRCGGEGHASPFTYAGGPFHYVEVRGVIRKRYFLSCQCPTCFKSDFLNACFEVELTKEQALDFERAQKAKHTTPVGRVEP